MAIVKFFARANFPSDKMGTQIIPASLNALSGVHHEEYGQPRRPRSDSSAQVSGLPEDDVFSLRVRS